MLRNIYSRTRVRLVAPVAATAVCLIVVMGQSSLVHASTIISDTFDANDPSTGTALVGRTPDTTDLPGTKWAQNNYALSGYHDLIVGSPTGSAELGADVGVGIALSPDTSTIYYISDSFSLNTDPTTAAGAHGAGLGFFTSVSSSANHGYNNFTGLAVNTDGTTSTQADIVLWAAGAATSDTATLTGWTGGSADHTLSYVVNTSTGGISSILLDGRSITLSGGTTAFTPTATALAGIANHASGFSSNTNALFNNFVVSSSPVPEPASLALVAVGAMGLLLLRRELRA